MCVDGPTSVGAIPFLSVIRQFGTQVAERGVAWWSVVLTDLLWIRERADLGLWAAINEIRQREGMIAIATSSSEGHSDAEAALNGGTFLH